jgi:hypothetical protein
MSNQCDLQTIELCIDDLRGAFERCRKCCENIPKKDLEGKFRNDYTKLLAETQEAAETMAGWLIFGDWIQQTEPLTDAEIEAILRGAADIIPLRVSDGKYTLSLHRSLITAGDWSGYIAEIRDAVDAINDNGAWYGLAIGNTAASAIDYAAAL